MKKASQKSSKDSKKTAVKATTLKDLDSKKNPKGGYDGTRVASKFTKT